MIDYGIEETDRIWYDDINIIYYKKGNVDEPKATRLFLEYTDNYKNYKDIIDYVATLVGGYPYLDSVFIIAERGLEGVVLRWNYVDGLYQVGTTRGYA